MDMKTTADVEALSGSSDRRTEAPLLEVSEYREFGIGRRIGRRNTR